MRALEKIAPQQISSILHEDSTPHKRRRSYEKSKFSPQEDQKLISIINEFGDKDWKLIASKLSGRNPRQCRERWNNYVNPQLSSAPWTTEEDKLLVEKFNEYGSRWHLIAPFFTKRSINNIKNRWFTTKRREKKQQPSVNFTVQTVLEQNYPIEKPHVTFDASSQMNNLKPINLTTNEMAFSDLFKDNSELSLMVDDNLLFYSPNDNDSSLFNF